MEWFYVNFKNGFLYEDNGIKMNTPKFEDWQEADEWLTQNMIRATIR